LRSRPLKIGGEGASSLSEVKRKKPCGASRTRIRVFNSAKGVLIWDEGDHRLIRYLVVRKGG